MTQPTNKLILYFFLTCAAIILAVSGWLVGQVFPAEDAVILFRYSQHLSQTGVISYNYGGGPVEGATDFLWMVLIALGHKLGISPYASSLLLSLMGLGGMTSLLWKYLVELRVAFLLGVMGLMLVPQWWAAVQGFSVYFWGMALMGVVFTFYHSQTLGFALFSLFACLIRPDSVVLVVPLALVYLIGRVRTCPDPKKDLKILLLAGLLPSLIYFLWRWNYFGEFLPLPFYVKGFQQKFLGIFDIESLKYWGIYLSRYLSPLLLPLIFNYKKLPRQNRFLFLICLFSPTLFYSTVALEQNVAHRFAMPLLIGVLACFLLSWKYIKKPLLWVRLFLACSAFYNLVYFSKSLSLRHDQFPLLAKEMARIPGSMAVTEAGRLPFYSGWECMDLWGLNTPSLSKKLVQKEDLEEFDPDLILLDDGQLSFDQLLKTLESPYQESKNWDNMVFNSLKFAIESVKYQGFLIPYQHPEKEELKWESFIYRFFPNTYHSRKDLILIHEDYAYKGELIPLLKKRGAKHWP